MIPTQNDTNKIFILLIFLFFLNADAQDVSTFAGSIQGYAQGTGIEAKFNQPSDIAADVAGNVYVADTWNSCIRKITAAGVVTTLAGSGLMGFADGTGTAAQFDLPCGVAIDAAGNVYVADTYNNLIRKITAAGVVTTLAGSGLMGFADGTGTAAQFNQPYGVAVDDSGNLFIGDRNNHRIRKITPVGVVSTLAGSTQGFVDDTGVTAQFSFPCGVATDDAGNIFVADSGNCRVRKINAAGVVSTLAGSAYGFADGTALVAQFALPSGVAIDAAGNIFVGDRNNNRIRKITPEGMVSTLAGSGVNGSANGIGTAAQFDNLFGVAVDGAGNVFVADTYNNRIRKIAAALATTNFHQNQVSIYPNPTTSKINIDIEDITIAKATILDMNGRALQTNPFINNETTIDVSHFSNGIYLMQITTDKGMVTKKIIKR